MYHLKYKFDAIRRNPYSISLTVVNNISRSHEAGCTTHCRIIAVLGTSFSCIGTRSSEG